MKEIVKINLFKVLITLVLVGSINWGLVAAFDFDLVRKFSSLFGSNNTDIISRIVYLSVAMSAIVLMVQRDTFLPFLGKTVMPEPIAFYTPAVIKPTGELITKTIEKLPPNVKVIYWASLPSDKVVDNPDEAYGNYSNQGVTITDANGKAILKVQKPASYKIPSHYDPFKGTLKPHIHYRYWISSGMTSPLYTINI
jgi:uncharacterized membrane protein YuzA (DUF378 family)